MSAILSAHLTESTTNLVDISAPERKKKFSPPPPQNPQFVANTLLAPRPVPPPEDPPLWDFQ